MPISRYVVTVTAGGTPDLFGPFTSRDSAWEFANKVRRNRRHDAGMPAVDVRPVQPGQLASVRL
jgi:hypothetical protein